MEPEPPLTPEKIQRRKELAQIDVPESFKLAVIGSPGHGKSTFLTAMVNESEQSEDSDYEFETGAGGDSCTKEVQSRTIDFKPKRKIGDKVEVNKDGKWVPGTVDYVYLTGECDVKYDDDDDDDGEIDTKIDKDNVRGVGGEDGVKLCIVDTMGFPDPDSNVSAQFYDDVVTNAVNRPGGLHALVWVLKQDRENEQIYKMYTAFMNELSQANCRLIMVINGTENITANSTTKKALKKCKTKKEESECIEKIRATFKETLGKTAQTLIDKLKFNASIDAIISTDIEVFENDTIHELVNMVRTCKLKQSNVRTFADLKAAFADASLALENYKKDLKSKLGKLKDDLDEEQERRRRVKREFEAQVRQAKIEHAAAMKNFRKGQQEMYAKSWFFTKAWYRIVGFPDENMPKMEEPVQSMSDEALENKIAEVRKSIWNLQDESVEKIARYQEKADEKARAVKTLADALNVGDAAAGTGYKPS